MTAPVDRILKSFRRPSARSGQRNASARSFLFLDAARAGEAAAVPGIVAPLERALAALVPALAVDLHVAPEGLVDPLGVIAAPARAFHIEAALSGVERQAGDVVMVHAAHVPGATVLAIAPRAPARMPLLVPPLEGLCGLRAPMGEEDGEIAAVAVACAAVAGLAAPDAAAPPPLVGAVAGLEDRLGALRSAAERSGDRMRLSECALLVAWCSVWCGLATADLALLADARRAIDALLFDADADLTLREAVRLQVLLAVTALARGGEADGAAILREGHAAAGSARALAGAAGDEPALCAALDGLAGELQLEIGRASGDRSILAAAHRMLERAAASVLAGERAAYWRALAAARRESHPAGLLKGQAPEAGPAGPPEAHGEAAAGPVPAADHKRPARVAATQEDPPRARAVAPAATSADARAEAAKVEEADVRVIRLRPENGPGRGPKP